MSRPLRLRSVSLSSMEMSAAGFASLVALTLGLGACASSRGSYVWADNVAPSETPTGYAIGVGDLLSVSVYGNDRLSTRTRVRSDGRISMPLLHDVQAAGRGPAELATELEKQFKEGDLVINPHVTVLVEEVRPISVAVLGAVSRAGTYALDPSAGVAEALAAAGGLTEFAHKDRLFVVRRTPQPMRIRFTFESITSATGRAPLFRLRSGDVVVAE